MAQVTNDVFGTGDVLGMYGRCARVVVPLLSLLTFLASQLLSFLASLTSFPPYLTSVLEMASLGYRSLTRPHEHRSHLSYSSFGLGHASIKK